MAGLSAGTLGATTLRRFAGDACSSNGASNSRFERRGGFKRWSLVDAPLVDASNLSGVRTAGLTSFVAFGGVRKIAAESGVRTAVRTAGGERVSVAARGVRTTGRAASGVRTMVSKHDLNGLVRGLAGAWGCIRLV